MTHLLESCVQPIRYHRRAVWGVDRPGWAAVEKLSLLFLRLVLHGPLARYVKLRVVHASEMLGTFSPPSRISDPDMHHDMHVPWCMPGLLTSSFLWSRWRAKRSRHSRRLCNAELYVSGNRPVLYSPHIMWFHLRNAVKKTKVSCEIKCILCFPNSSKTSD